MNHVTKCNILRSTAPILP